MSTVIKLTRGVPAAESFPTEQLSECARAVLLDNGKVVLQYGPASGFPPLRAHIAQEANASDSQVIITPGTLQLQDFCARTLLKAGDIVYVEEPTYDRTVTILRRAGAQVLAFRLEADGPDVDAMAARLRGGERPVLFYTVPDFQNPSGTVSSAEKRRRLAGLAEQYGFWIIEDAPYRKLRYRGQAVPALVELAPQRVIHMSSYSKLISPGLRVGYCIAPEALAGRLFKYAEDTYITPNYLDQAIVFEYIRRGWLATHIEELKALYAPRLDAMLAALAGQLAGLGDWRKPDGGFFIGLTLDVSASTDELLAKARQAGLILSDGRGFFAAGGGDHFVRLPFCALSNEEIQAGIERLAGVARALRQNQ